MHSPSPFAPTLAVMPVLSSSSPVLKLRLSPTPNTPNFSPRLHMEQVLDELLAEIAPPKFLPDPDADMLPGETEAEFRTWCRVWGRVEVLRLSRHGAELNTHSSAHFALLPASRLAYSSPSPSPTPPAQTSLQAPPQAHIRCATSLAFSCGSGMRTPRCTHAFSRCAPALSTTRALAPSKSTRMRRSLCGPATRGSPRGCSFAPRR